MQLHDCNNGCIRITGASVGFAHISAHFILKYLTMANNFFLNQDPLLYHGTTPSQGMDDMLQQRINDTVLQYNMLQQKRMDIKDDLIGKLNDLTRGLNAETINVLNKNNEYIRLNGELQSIIQDEILSNIKWRINSNPTAVKNIQRQMEMIDEAKHAIDDEQRRNINELNDYVKNYSNITFDEYKRIKNGGNINTETPNTDNNKSKNKK